MDPVLLQKQVRDNAEDLRNHMQELKNWEAEMKRKESELLASASGNQALPPVRSKIKRTSIDQKSKHEKQNERPVRISGYDYTAWDKFDVDKACEELDIGGHEESEEDGDDRVSDTEEKRLREEAVYEKIMGNDLVKNQKWKEAIQCYSRAIKCFPYDAIFYANRALCYLKTQDLRSAEVDCTTALQLDSSYVKAYQRRAMARIRLGQLQEARADLLKVMELEPKNMESKAELMKLEKKINIKPQQKSVKDSSSGACSIVIQQTEKQAQTSSVIFESEKVEEETGKQNESEWSCSKQIIKEKNKLIPRTSGKKTIVATEIEKKAKCSSNQEIVDGQSGESWLLQNIASQEQIWPTHGQVTLVQSIHKPPHLRSKKALKRIEIREVDNTSNHECEESTKACTNGAASVGNESNQIALGIDAREHKSDKEQTLEEICEVIDAESNKIKPVPEKANSVSQNTVTELLSGKESEEVPPIPKTSVQFLAAWKKVRTNPRLRYLYLKQIPGADFPKIFHDCLESSTLSDIISTIKTGFLQFKEPALPYIMGLSNVRRFGALAMFMSQNDKAGIKEILKYCKEQGECSEEDCTDIVKKYELY
ncbi:hypothetical protein B7P43_G05929 [Cryptotermes secundus]|nr:RNA polymerase II-associated protein 3 isoform X2 [Cryptotermes secundus]XP_023727458.1 RNA polymerase II-associated protein 3 isoform X2 [Cryptotermes secundus]PNF40621.1 hypothetical protein B7P43_G05929 [Cryptotermes secundus]PNF40622.1 hypothetical protein B7P43_G05929 [Cryptotermes secundus]